MSDKVFAELFDMIESRSVRILEIGTIRPSHSLLKFADHVWKYGGSVISIDSDSHVCDLARSMITDLYDQKIHSGEYIEDSEFARSENLDAIQVIQSDSIEYLADHEDPIDVLYLDSANNADLILAEANKNLHDGSLILIENRDYQCLMRRAT